VVRVGEGVQQVLQQVVPDGSELIEFICQENNQYLQRLTDDASALKSRRYEYRYLTAAFT
jgi:hypothetical protein